MPISYVMDDSLVVVFRTGELVIATDLAGYEAQAKSLGVSTLHLIIDSQHPWRMLAPLLVDYASTGPTSNCGTPQQGWSKRLDEPVLDPKEIRMIRERAGVDGRIR